jgi:hypothetical protein
MVDKSLGRIAVSFVNKRFQSSEADINLPSIGAVILQRRLGFLSRSTPGAANQGTLKGNALGRVVGTIAPNGAPAICELDDGASHPDHTVITNLGPCPSLYSHLFEEVELPETAKGMPAHPRFVKLHGFEAFCKPTFFNVVVQVRRAVPGLEQQAILAAYEHSQVLCNFRVQIDVAVCRIRWQG